MDYKKVNAENTTITRDLINLSEDIGNVYQTVVVLSKRANQVSSKMKEDLTSKLEEFASATDNLEEIFENREQIEISKHYERMPKPTGIAIQELIEGDIFLRDPEEDSSK